ncbi:hypothetical protein DB356_23510 [Pseudomonas congelans]|uniref:hypothetical protein n=1 Tax=Pseudomonas congelans TaxID=200452 RepID=UPI001BDDA5F6|nr:hypothetical protein [Pseudomonas congelans]QVX17438.1 hypothetical protein DB356_23510 [Pseudomonas congelans]
MVFIDHTGVGFRFNKDGVVVKRPWIELIGTYRTQPDPGAQAYTPTAHDYDYVFYNCDSVVRNIVIWNSTKGIYITADASNSQSRGDISGVYGCPVQLGIVVDFLADVLRVDNVHFWPYWTSNANFAAYQRSNAVGMSFYRCDNPMITRYFTYGYRLSIYMGSNSKGVTSKLKMQVFDFDFIGQSGVLIDGSGISCALSGGSGQGHSAKTANNFLEVTSGSSGCNVSVDNIDVGLFKQNVLRCGGAASSVMRVGDNVRLYQWNGSGVGFPAIGCTENNFVELSTMPYFTAPLNEGTPLDTAGNIKGRIELPRRTYNTDANGRTVLQSGMGRAPSSIVATAIDDSVAYSIQQTSIANVVLASTVSSGAALVNSKIVIAATLGFS